MLAAAKKIIYKNGRLKRPSSAPALQTAHVANVGTRICAISNGSQIPIDLLGNTYVSQGASTQAVQSLTTIGSAVTNNSVSRGWQITGLTVETPTSVTLAAIVWMISGRAGANLLCVCTNSSSANATGGVFFGPLNGGGLLLQSPGPVTFKTSSVKLPIGGPVFIAASCNASANSFVMTDLVTGQVQSTTGTGLAFSVNDGTYCFGATPQIHLNSNYQAAAMMSNADLTLAQMLAWAQNPWSFWYPV